MIPNTPSQPNYGMTVEPNIGLYYTNHYTRLDNLAWSHTVFYQFSFCKAFSFMEPLLFSGVENQAPPLT